MESTPSLLRRISTEPTRFHFPDLTVCRVHNTTRVAGYVEICHMEIADTCIPYSIAQYMVGRRPKGLKMLEIFSWPSKWNFTFGNNQRTPVIVVRFELMNFKNEWRKRLAFLPASLVACLCESLKYAGTVTTASVTFSPR